MATLFYSYDNFNLHQVVNYNYDDVAHAITYGNLPGTPRMSGLTPGSTIRTHTVGTDNWAHRVQDAHPYVYIYYYSTAGPPCDLNITVINKVDAMNGNPGQITITATGTGTKRYSLDGGAPQVSNVFNGVAPGVHTVKVSRTEDTCKSLTQNVTIASNADLTASCTPQNATANGLDDGKITIDIFTGSGDFTVNCTTEAISFPLSGVPTQGIRYPLAPGSYHIDVIDNVTAQIRSFDLVITEPELVPKARNNFFSFPIMNSLSFVREAIIDNCNVYQTMDNTLFCKQKFPGFTWQNYYQKVQQCDTFPLQFYSNYSAHKLVLKKYSNNAVIKSDYAFEKKESNTNQEKIYDIFITANPADGTKSRVYFQADAQIPIPLEEGDALTITNNVDGFNGSYTVVAISLDELLGKQYFLINKAYGLVTPSTLGKATFVVDDQEFDVYEVMVPWATITEGKYFMELSTQAGDNDVVYVSEPIEVKQLHELCNLFEYRNFDNAFDMTYTTGITCMRRVESRLFNRLPKGEDDTYRNTDQSLVKLSAKRRRGFLLETFQLTPYLHEVMSVMFGHDYIAINKVRYQTSEQYEDPKYILRYPLSNSQIGIEQYGWFDKYNGDDIGPVDAVETGFIIANGGFIKREP